MWKYIYVGGYNCWLGYKNILMCYENISCVNWLNKYFKCVYDFLEVFLFVFLKLEVFCKKI